MTNETSKLPIAAVATVICFFWCSTVRAVDDGIAKKTCIIQVLDQAGKPVKGALVSLSGEKPKSDSRWAEGTEEPDAPTWRSDEQGNVPVSYYANPYPNEAPPGVIRLLVQYEDGSLLCTEVNVDAQQPVKLLRGTDVELAPQPITDVAFAKVSADLQIDQWPGKLQLKPSSNRQLIEVNLPSGTYRVRFTAITAGGKAYYSDLTRMTVNAPSGNIGDKPKPFRKLFALRDTVDGTIPLPTKQGVEMMDGAGDDLLAVINMALLAWILFSIFCSLIQHPSWVPWNNRLWIPTGFLLVACVALSITLKSITSILLLISDLFPLLAWIIFVALLYLARKKGWPLLFWTCIPLLGLIVLILLFFSYATVTSLLADFNPSFAYTKEFGEFPSNDVRDIQSTRNNAFFDCSQVILKFHASRATFERIKPHSLIQVSYEQFQHIYEDEEFGGMLANYIRQDNLDPDGDQIIASWCKQFDAPGEEIWHLPRNDSDSDKETLMAYDPSSGTVRYFYFELE